MIFDKYGMIISGGDGGDSCHRMFAMHLYQRILNELDLPYIGKFDFPESPSPLAEMANAESTQVLLEVEPGIYVRNPDPTMWYSDPRTFSRDQTVPVICYHAVMAKVRAENLEHLKDLLKACLKRGMFAQNIYPNWFDPRTSNAVRKKLPDFLDPSLWGMFSRGFMNDKWYLACLLSPLVLFSDLFLILSVAFKLWAPINQDGTFKFRMSGPGDCDDMNLNNCLITAQYRFPTVFSWIARKMYKKFRKSNYGNTELGEREPIMGALAWYNKENPEITETIRRLVERY